MSLLPESKLQSRPKTGREIKDFLSGPQPRPEHASACALKCARRVRSRRLPCSDSRCESRIRTLCPGSAGKPTFLVDEISPSNANRHRTTNQVRLAPTAVPADRQSEDYLPDTGGAAARAGEDHHRRLASQLKSPTCRRCRRPTAIVGLSFSSSLSIDSRPVKCNGSSHPHFAPFRSVAHFFIKLENLEHRDAHSSRSTIICKNGNISCVKVGIISVFANESRACSIDEHDAEMANASAIGRIGHASQARFAERVSLASSGVT